MYSVIPKLEYNRNSQNSPKRMHPKCHWLLQATKMTSVSVMVKGTVSWFYDDFERFKNTPRSYVTQQIWFYFVKHHSTNDNNPLGSEDG